MTADLTAAAAGRRSPFAGADVCRQAGFRLPAGTSPPRFEDDVWDLAEVIGLPVQLRLSARRLDFTAIKEPRWQLVAKELMLALLAHRTRRDRPQPGQRRALRCLPGPPPARTRRHRPADRAPRPGHPAVRRPGGR